MINFTGYFLVFLACKKHNIALPGLLNEQWRRTIKITTSQERFTIRVRTNDIGLLTSVKSNSKAPPRIDLGSTLKRLGIRVSFMGVGLF